MAKRLTIREKRKEQEQAQHPQKQEGGQGFKTYTSMLKEDTSQKDEPTTKITLRVPESVAGLIDEVFGKKKLRGEVKNKYEFIAEILRPYLESEKKRILKLEIQELETKKQQLVSLSE